MELICRGKLKMSHPEQNETGSRSAVSGAHWDGRRAGVPRTFHSWGIPVREGLVLRLSLSRAGKAEPPSLSPFSCSWIPAFPSPPAPAGPSGTGSQRPRTPSAPPGPSEPGGRRARAHLVGEAGGQVEEAEGEAARRSLQIHV